MKSVLISIKKQWIEKILDGEKTIEVRKTKPNLEVPFNVYIYCTKDNQHYDLYINEKSAREVYGNFSRLRAGQDKVVETVNEYNTFIAHGKVIGEFVCDKVFDIPFTKPFLYYGKKMFHSNNCCKEACLSYIELEDYLDNKDGFGWHISNLKIYDKPILLEELGVDKAPQSWRYI